MFYKICLRSIVLLLLVFATCSAQKAVTTIRLDEQHVVLLYNREQSGKFLINDPIDHFFERVTPVEMSIQMKKSIDDGTDRTQMLEAYRRYLVDDVADFSGAESKKLVKVVKEMHRVCDSFSSEILPDTLILIKTLGKHYGPGVYYTRANSIIIPADALEADDLQGLMNTLFHELSHVYTRLNPAKKEALYRLIGFESIGYNNVYVPPGLAARLLHNPDGVDFAQKIRLRTSDSTYIEAIPIIYANAPGYQSSKQMFFAYLEFNLFAVEPAAEGGWKVLTKQDGISSTLNLRRLPDFYRQIRDNTGYIIHPDEIIADNFAFLMAAKAGYGTLDNFSPAGKELLQAMDTLLR